MSTNRFPAACLRHTRLFGFGHRAQQPGVQLGPAVEAEEPVALLLDVGQLGVAEALYRARPQQCPDLGAIGGQQLARPTDLAVGPAARAGKADAAELADDDRLTPVRVPGQVVRQRTAGGVEGGVQAPVAAPEVLRAFVVVEGAEVGFRVLPAIVETTGRVSSNRCVNSYSSISKRARTSTSTSWMPKLSFIGTQATIEGWSRSRLTAASHSVRSRRSASSEWRWKLGISAQTRKPRRSAQ